MTVAGHAGPAPAVARQRPTGQPVEHRWGRRDGAARVAPAGPVVRPVPRPRTDPRMSRRAWSGPAGVPRPARRRSPGPGRPVAGGRRRRRRDSADPETVAATRPSARRPRTARRDRATGRRSLDSSGGPVAAAGTSPGGGAGRDTRIQDRPGRPDGTAPPGPGRGSAPSQGPFAHGRAPIVGSRPLAHSDVTSSEMVALGTPGPAKSLVRAPNGCAWRVAARAWSPPLRHPRRPKHYPTDPDI